MWLDVVAVAQAGCVGSKVGSYVGRNVVPWFSESNLTGHCGLWITTEMDAYTVACVAAGGAAVDAAAPQIRFNAMGYYLLLRKYNKP